MTREEALAEIEAARREGRPAQLTGADLEGANLEAADLKYANLQDASLANANLEGANLVEAYLKGAILGAANLRGAKLGRANLTNANLKGANLTGAVLINAHLDGADLTSAHLTRADLYGAILNGAILYGAYLIGADLSRAKLEDAILTRASLTSANLEGANLTGTNLGGAILADAKLDRANLTNANLEGAYLEGANLTDANLSYTNLWDANLRRAKLDRADLEGANLYNAMLYLANLTSANLEGAILASANLEGAILTDTDGLDALSDATGVTWPAGFSPPTSKVTPYRAYGKKSAAVLKLRKPDTPRSARDFKKKYPTEFEALKQDTQGRDFSDQIIELVQARHTTPFDWTVTYGKYRADAQRLCSKPNEVIKLNIDLTDPRFTDREREILSKIMELSRRSGHPVEKHPFFTIGWVRYCELPDIKTILVEEVQSDVQGVRKGLKDPATRMQLESGGLDVAEIEAATALLLPYTERFYEDALGIIFDIAQKSGSKVEMLHYDTKRQFGSPSAIYTDLPRSMGMKLGPGSDVLPGRDDVKQTWKITPNRKRKTSRRARRRTSRR